MKIGIIGTGKISANFFDAARRVDGIAATALLSRDAARGAEFARAHGGMTVYTDPNAFFSSGIDAVYVANPNSAHFDSAAAALVAGKHVLLEKPATDTAEKFARLCRLADERGCVLMEAMRPLHLPFLEKVRKMLPEIGKIRRVTLEYCQYSSRYDAFRAGEVKNAFNPALSNAALMDIGVYPAAVAMALFGAPQTVKAQSVFLSNGFEGAGEALLGYDGFTLSLVWSKIADSVTPSVFMGEEGTLLLDRVNGPTEATLILRNGATRVLRNEPCENDMVYELADFAAAAAGKKSALPYRRISEITLTLLDRIRAEAGIAFPENA